MADKTARSRARENGALPGRNGTVRPDTQPPRPRAQSQESAGPVRRSGGREREEKRASRLLEEEERPNISAPNNAESEALLQYIHLSKQTLTQLSNCSIHRRKASA